MRAFIATLALLAAPAVVAAQGSGKPNQPGAVDPAKCAVAEAHRSENALKNGGPNAPGDYRRGCSPVPPAPTTPPQPPPPPPPPPPSGTVVITGMVYQDITGRPRLEGWTIALSGMLSATAATDVNGNYTFSGLPAGTYTICEVLLDGWVQTFPGRGTVCPTGFGYTFTLADGQTGSFVNFGNVQQ